MDLPHLCIVDILGQSRKWYKTSYVQKSYWTRSSRIFWQTTAGRTGRQSNITDPSPNRVFTKMLCRRLSNKYMLFIFQEFFLHLLTVMERENRKRGQTNHAFSSLQFKVEDRLECGATKQVICLSIVCRIIM